MSKRLQIVELGARGDGIAHTEAGPIYVPFSLPGESVSAQVEGKRGKLLSIEEPSSLRTAPMCRHFGHCGGCTIQHLAPDAYAEWKRNKVQKALLSRGIEAEVDPLTACSPATRRRVTFTARRSGRRVLFGFNAEQSHRTIDVDECPIAVPQIVEAFPRLRALADILCRESPLRFIVTATRTGLDVAVTGKGELAAALRRDAIELVLKERFARLSVDGDILIERERPVIFFGDALVSIPPGGFLQATAEAEEAMAHLVIGHIGAARNVADLFAGSGSFALRIARYSRVHAVEGDALALTALEEAARHTAFMKPVTTERRDLFHRPLTTKDLSRFDALVFDPPRAGAEAQCRQIARSAVKRIAAVSCNPGTLARDLAILVEGGYRITRVTPIDQFLWSAHVEVVALLERKGK